MVKAFYCMLAAVMAVGCGNAQAVRHGDCVVDVEILTLPGCALETRGGHLYVSQKYLSLYFSASSSASSAAGSVPPGKNRMASTHLPDGGGWAYFDRSGRIVVQHVATTDNGPSAFHQGLVRVMRNGKYGLANTRGQLIVPMQYDGMLDYEPGRGWLACTGCQLENDASGEYGTFKGGKWVRLGPQGQVLRAANDPSNK